MEKTKNKMPAWLSCFACGKSSKDDDDDVKTAATTAPPEVKVGKLGNECAAPKVEVTKVEETKITAEAEASTPPPPQLKDDPAVLKQPANDEEKRDTPAAEVVAAPDAIVIPEEPISVQLKEEVAAVPEVTPSPPPSPKAEPAVETAAATAAEAAITTTAAAAPDADEVANSINVNHAGSENTDVANGDGDENLNGVCNDDNGLDVDGDDAAELERFEALERTLVDGADAVVGAISADGGVQDHNEEEAGGKASPFKTDYSSDGALSDLEHADDDEFLVASPPDNPGNGDSARDNPVHDDSVNDNPANGDSARDKPPSSHIPSRIGRATGIPLPKSAVSPPPPPNDTLITPVSKSPPPNDTTVTPVSKKVSASRLPTPASKIPTTNSSNNSNNNTPSSKIPMPRSGPRKSQSGIPARIR